MLIFSVFILFLFLRFSSCQEDPEIIERYTKQIRKSLTEVLVRQPHDVQVKRTLNNFASLLNESSFVANYHGEKNMRYDSFLYYLTNLRKRVIKVEIVPDDTYSNMLMGKHFEPMMTLKLVTFMNYTITEKYHFKVQLGENHSYKILKIDIGGYSGPDEENPIKSNWIQKNFILPLVSANFFAENTCKDLTFSSYMPSVMDDSERDRYFTDDFFALIDTNYFDYYYLDQFLLFMRKFTQKYQIQSTHNKFKMIIQDKDHIVFQIDVPFKYDQTDEKWNFEIEAMLIGMDWRFSKIFIKHPYDSNQIILERSGKELLEVLKSEFTRAIKNSNILEINKTLTEDAQLDICPDLKGRGGGLNLILSKWEGTAHIYSTYTKTGEIFIDLYFPDDLGNLIVIKFDTEIVPKYDEVRITLVTVDCPEVSVPPSFEKTDFEGISIDMEPIRIPPKEDDYENENGGDDGISGAGYGDGDEHFVDVEDHGDFVEQREFSATDRLFHEFSAKVRNLLVETSNFSGDDDFSEFNHVLDEDFLYAGRFNKENCIFSLAMRRKRFSTASILDYNATTTENTKNTLLLNLTNIMDYSLIVRYEFMMKFDMDKHLKVISLSLHELNTTTLWTPKTHKVSVISGPQHAESISGRFFEIPQSEKSYGIPLFGVNVTDKYGKKQMFTDDFEALIDTNYDITYKLDEFLIYMARFSQYYHQNNASKPFYRYIIEDVDHIVFATDVWFNYEDQGVELWNFEIESVYVNNNWMISKIFVGTPFKNLGRIQDRASVELMEFLKQEISNLPRMLNDVNSMVGVNICPELKGKEVESGHLIYTSIYQDDNSRISFEFWQKQKTTFVISFPIKYNEIYNLYRITGANIGCLTPSHYTLEDVKNVEGFKFPTVKWRFDPSLNPVAQEVVETKQA